MEENENKEEYSHFWLNLIIIVYICFGAVGNFFINLSVIDVEKMGGFMSLGIIFASVMFPLLAFLTFRAFEKGTPDAVYIASIYLCYNAAVAVCNEDWARPVIDLICLAYLHNSGLVEELIPSIDRDFTRRCMILSGLCGIGAICELIFVLSFT